MLLRQLSELECVTAHYKLLWTRMSLSSLRQKIWQQTAPGFRSCFLSFRVVRTLANYLTSSVCLSALIGEAADPHTCLSFMGLPCEGTLGSMTQVARAGSAKYQGVLLGLSYVPAADQNFSALHPFVLSLSTMGHRLHKEVTQSHRNKSTPGDVNIRLSPQH